MDTSNEELNIKVSGRKDLLIDSLNVLITLVIVLGGAIYGECIILQKFYQLC